MKMRRWIPLLLIVGLVMIGACGCMNRNNHEIEISGIKSTIEQRYGEEFTIEYFLPAKGKLYDNILTLSNKEGVVFNAYKMYGGSVISDNYLEALINRKLTSYLTGALSISSNLNVSVFGMIKDGSVLTLDFAKKYVASTSNQDFVKIVAVIAVNGELTNHKDELFIIYNEILKFGSDLIEFEVISLSNPGEELSKVLNNPLGYYNNNWDGFSEIASYIDIRTKDIASADELVKGAK